MLDGGLGAKAAPPWCVATVVGSALLGLTLMVDQAHRLSATYDEVTYLRVAARWWRTGEQESITRMGTPLTFWKIQQGPTFWLLDRVGRGAWVDDPIENQAELLPIVRVGGLWIWLVGLLIAAEWARRLYGPRAMAMASAVFAMSPNLLAHGALATMEMPTIASLSGMAFGFWCFLRSGRPRAFWASAALGGLAMSCKFTTILMPPILGLAWAIDLARARGRDEGPIRALARVARRVIPGMAGFVLILVASDVIVTGFATTPLSAHTGSHPLLDGRFSPTIRRWAGQLFETPLPSDWVGFATQVVYQGQGGPSYLLGERRMTGWLLYYPVTLAVKVPLAFWLLVAGRARRPAGDGSGGGDRGWMLPMIVLTFLLAAMLGSKRNYGVRYLLPVAVPAIVWVSATAEWGRRSRLMSAIGVGGMAASLAWAHPHELSYFNEVAGGPIGGRRILSDSNLDWGQGAKSLARLQRDRPEFRDLTLFYFGDTDPAYYGVRGRRIIFDANHAPSGLPDRLTVETPYLAVSASLQWGPWGPPGYFRELDRLRPVGFTDDATIALYRAADLEASRSRGGHAE